MESDLVSIEEKRTEENLLPKRYRKIFSSAKKMLMSHRIDKSFQSKEFP
ncbi:MAG: hypothetical protein CM1200mP28_07990 [Deltaproteobacteria bacterium]|nr:MAG: hypothetical protein CM1200mP28_07990 [Deltaproteobacteria bacterium]